jgi:hypothetical protein
MTPVWVLPGRTLPAGSLSADDRITRNEAQVMDYLERLVAAQLAFRMASGGRFASLAELQQQERELEAPFVDQDYVLALYVTEATAFGPADFFVLATPRLAGLTGRRAFYVDASGIIRSSDAGQPWLPAARQWAPVRSRSAG